MRALLVKLLTKFLFFLLKNIEKGRKNRIEYEVKHAMEEV